MPTNDATTAEARAMLAQLLRPTPLTEVGYTSVVYSQARKNVTVTQNLPIIDSTIIIHFMSKTINIELVKLTPQNV